MVYREADILAWATMRDIIGPNGKATTTRQLEKTCEEVTELRDAILANDRQEVCDAIGDVFVTLCIQASMWNLTMQQCIEHAYRTIANRTGRMVDGQFIKDVP